MKVKMVIEISEDDLEAIKYLKVKGWASRHELLILNGTPLPKGHGDLIDRDKIDWFGCTTEEKCPYKDRACKDCMNGECYKPQIDALPTIIEADGGDAE